MTGCREGSGIDVPVEIHELGNSTLVVKIFRKLYQLKHLRN
jgi:hypothetical protein